MNLARTLATAALSLFVTSLGCSGADPEATTSAAIESKAGYGYEFNVDKIPASAARSDAPADSVKIAKNRIPPEVIRDGVRASSDALKSCYDEAIKRDPTIPPSVTVRFSIRPDGSVEEAKSGGDANDDVMSACVAGVFRALSFPSSPAGPVAVIYPIEFSR